MDLLANMVTTNLRLGFLLMPRYSMIALSSIIEPLRMANQLSGQSLYDWIILSSDGQPVSASNGLQASPVVSIDDCGRLDLLFVCGGMEIRLASDKRILNWLRRLARRQVPLGGICTGSYALAKASLLDGYRATIHWEHIAGLREEFPHIISTHDLFVMDRDRFTSSGGIAPLDMMLTLISQHHGIELAAAISEEFVHDRIRTVDDHQREPLKLRIGLGQPKLIEAVSLMEANLEEPIPLDDLARYVNVSRRQLERLFKRYLNCVPTRYYLTLRLTRARQLLLQTDLSIANIALTCGFISAAHFSKCYRELYSRAPSHERRPAFVREMNESQPMMEATEASSY